MQIANALDRMSRSVVKANSNVAISDQAKFGKTSDAARFASSAIPIVGTDAQSWFDTSALALPRAVGLDLP